eukprot:gene1485-1642_t
MEHIHEFKRLLVNKLESLIALTRVGEDCIVLEDLVTVQGYLVYLDSITRVPEEATGSLLSARRILEQKTNSKIPAALGCGRAGRPKYDITEEQLQVLLQAGFKIPSIASLLHVSKRTVERRMQEFGLTASSRFSSISNESLDEMVREVKEMNSHCGSKLLAGYLRSKGTFVQ